MQSTTAENLSRWLQAASADSARIKLCSTGEHGTTLLETDAKRALDPANTEQACAEIVRVAEQWAQGAPGDHHFIVQVVDADGRPVQSSQFRIVGDAEPMAKWATGTPEAVVAQLQGSLASMTKLYQEGWKNLQTGYIDLTKLQQQRINALEAEVSNAKSHAGDLETMAEEGLEALQESERFEKLLMTVREIASQWKAAKADPEAVARAAARAAAQKAAGAVGEAAAEAAAKIDPTAGVQS